MDAKTVEEHYAEMVAELEAKIAVYAKMQEVLDSIAAEEGKYTYNEHE
jgi:hypothetical protein